MLVFVIFFSSIARTISTCFALYRIVYISSRCVYIMVWFWRYQSIYERTQFQHTRIDETIRIISEAENKWNSSKCLVMWINYMENYLRKTSSFWCRAGGRGMMIHNGEQTSLAETFLGYAEEEKEEEETWDFVFSFRNETKTFLYISNECHCFAWNRHKWVIQLGCGQQCVYIEFVIGDETVPIFEQSIVVW